MCLGTNCPINSHIVDSCLLFVYVCCLLSACGQYLVSLFFACCFLVIYLVLVYQLLFVLCLMFVSVHFDWVWFLGFTFWVLVFVSYQFYFFHCFHCLLACFLRLAFSTVVVIVFVHCLLPSFITGCHVLFLYQL